MRFVLDCSTTMAWCFNDEATAGTDAVLKLLSKGEALVPSIWPLEVVNVLLVAERNKRLSRLKPCELLTFYSRSRLLLMKALRNRP